MASILQIENRFKKLDVEQERLVSRYNIKSHVDDKHRYIQDVALEQEEDMRIYGKLSLPDYRTPGYSWGDCVRV